MDKCPQGHQSESPDFCSVCGVEITGAAAVEPASSPALAANSSVCPECGTPCERPGQVFCEVCGYNFRTRASGIPPLAGPGAPVPEPVATAAADPPVPTSGQGLSIARWDVVVEVDDCLYGNANPDAPRDRPIQTFTLFTNESLIGRAGTEVRVQVPVADDHGVSRRHALLVRQPDGGLILRDLGSTNGTQLNGIDVLPGADVPVKDGDRIGIGGWTRITLRAVRR